MKKIFFLLALILLSCKNDPVVSPCGPFTLKVSSFADTLSASLSANDTTFIIFERISNPKQKQIPLPFKIEDNSNLLTEAKIIFSVTDSVYTTPTQPVKSVQYIGDTVFIWFSHFAKPNAILGKNSSGIQCTPPPQQEFSFSEVRILKPAGRNISFTERKR